MSNADLVITKRPQLKIEILGQIYEVTKPSYKQSKELDKDVTEAGDKGALDVTIKHLIKCGIAETAFEELSVDDILEVSRLVFGVKKK